MKVSVVTPSLSQSEWLRLCVASVADQGADHEHIIQDAGSKDGTVEWLRTDSRVRAFVESDKGMYDAVNRGLRRSEGEILAYLNCDEQYLPGALETVVETFGANPAVDVLFGDVIVVDSDCEYLLHRKSLPPLKWHTRLGNLSTLTCATFFRRRLLDEWNLFFSEEMRYSGDLEWMLRLIDRGVRMASVGKFTSVFGYTGENLGYRDGASGEFEKFCGRPPLLASLLSPAIVTHHRLRRLWRGAYFQRPFSFDLYVHGQTERRVRREVEHPRSTRWISGV